MGKYAMGEEMIVLSITRAESGIFIGEDGSMGLRHGERYECYIEILPSGRISISIGWGWHCPYDTMSALQKNWDFRKPSNRRRE